MKQILTLLIQDDIKQTRLVRTLNSINIDASEYLTNKSSVIFMLMGIESEQGNEPFLDAYFRKIEIAVADQTEEKHIDLIINWLEVIAEGARKTQTAA